MSVLAIFGPTATGKTAVAEALADRIPAELVSADSMQVYRGLPILTNQPVRPTRLVGIWELDHEASVGEYGALAHAAVDEILEAGRTPVVVGGPGRYQRAAVAEQSLPPPPPPRAPERRTPPSPTEIRRPRPPSTRTTGAVSCARWNLRRQGVRSRRRRTGSGPRIRGIRR